MRESHMAVIYRNPFLIYLDRDQCRELKVDYYQTESSQDLKCGAQEVLASRSILKPYDSDMLGNLTSLGEARIVAKPKKCASSPEDKSYYRPGWYEVVAVYDGGGT